MGDQFRQVTDALRVAGVTVADIADRSGSSLQDVSAELAGRRPMSLHTVEAIAYDVAGLELTRDEADLNSGPHRFNVRLIQPISGKTYRESLRIEAAVDLPSELKLDRVELFLAAIRANRVDGGLEELGRLHARNLDRVLKGFKEPGGCPLIDVQGHHLHATDAGRAVGYGARRARCLDRTRRSRGCSPW